MALQGMSGLLDKFRNLIASSVETENVIIREVELSTKVKLEKSELSVKQNILYLKISPTKRNEIFLRKESVLEKINKDLPEKSRIRDIK
jgi:hypothetical protein